MGRIWPEEGEYLTLKTDPWPLKYFSKDDLRCKGSGMIIVPLMTVSKLDAARHEFGPFTVISGYRTSRYNARVGGSPTSMHIEGRAFDIDWGRMGGVQKWSLMKCLLNAGFTGFGIHHHFIHADDGAQRVWVDETDV